MISSEKPLISHEMEVIPPGMMQSSLQILGLDFWEKLNPEIKWKEREIHALGCTRWQDFRHEVLHDKATESNKVASEQRRDDGLQAERQ